MGYRRSRTSVIAAIALALSGTALAGDVVVSGVVRDADTLDGVSDAMVSLQAAGVRTLTAADGSYSLTIPDVDGSVIVAAKKGYFNRSTVYEGAPTNLDILIDLVPQDDDASYTLMPAEACSFCHPNQYDEWNDSPMQKGGVNTWIHDIYNGDGTEGGLGGFVYTRDSMFAKSNPASDAPPCHQPESWIYDPGSRVEGPSDDGYPSYAASHGISCDVCHKVAHVNVENINYPGIFEGGVTFTRPAGPEHLQVQYGLLGDVDYDAPFNMRASYQPQLAAEVCGACHQDKNDLHEDGSFDGVISEPTYLEWADSPYGDLASPLYASCVDCHMLPTGETTICEVLFPPIERDPATIRSHDVRGTTPEYLENAADVEVHLAAAAGVLNVTVDVINSQTGHHVPTGVTIRNMILLVEAWREDDGLPLEPTGDQVIHELGGVGDPAEGYYAGLPGKFFAKINHGKDGTGPTFFTDAFGIIQDTRIPALQTDTTSYTFAIPDGGGTLRVRARLIYRRAFRAFVDAKQWTEDGHGNPLADALPPHYGHLMEEVHADLAACGAADVDGDLTVGFGDLLTVLSYWGPCPGCAADLDGDGTVGLLDLVEVLNGWGPCF